MNDLKKKTLVLMILDGWGYRENIQYNAIAQAKTPQWDEWWQTRPHLLLDASGYAVGLPEGQMGNSEVGHMHIGAGRIIFQDYTRINLAIEEGSFFTNPVFINVIQAAKHQNKTLHILGLLSDGGVHSHENHLFAFLKLCHQYQFSDIALHLILDGRDTPPKSALNSLKRLHQHLEKYPAHIASITGRFFAMDRDKRWDRVESFYQLLTTTHDQTDFKNAEDAIAYYYQQNITDEFIPPTRIGIGHPIQDNDCVFFFNYRADRVRQITHALIDSHFDHFQRQYFPKINQFVSMTAYEKDLPTICAFPPLKPNNTLGEMVAQKGMTQLRIAETEKYAHVTFFFNGGREQPFEHEERILVQSPFVKTYDQQPEMSVPELTHRLIEAINSQQYDFIVCNYANADMVGHTGNFTACVRAIECLDQAMEKIWKALERIGGQMLITADHGNAECMFDAEHQQTHTAHTSDPVPFIYLGDANIDLAASIPKKPGLIDIAPTILLLLGITPPLEMTGHNLLVKTHEPFQA